MFLQGIVSNLEAPAVRNRIRKIDISQIKLLGFVIFI